MAIAPTTTATGPGTGNRPALRCLRWILLALSALLPCAATEPEDELKAATVLTFIRHSEWREAAAGPIRIAVLGRPAMVHTLRRNLEGRTANNRALQVVDGGSPAEVRSCHVLYIASDNRNEIRKALTEWRASRALTLGESDRFLEYGGAVNLMIVDGHMSFEVSREALDRAGVAISSTLLRYGQVSSTAATHPGRPPL